MLLLVGVHVVVEECHTDFQVPLLHRGWRVQAGRPAPQQGERAAMGHASLPSS